MQNFFRPYNADFSYLLYEIIHTFELVDPLPQQHSLLHEWKSNQDLRCFIISPHFKTFQQLFGSARRVRFKSDDNAFRYNLSSDDRRTKYATSAQANGERRKRAQESSSTRINNGVDDVLPENTSVAV